MVEIKNTHVYNLKKAVLASGNAMRLEPEVNEENFNSSLERCKRLAKLGGGTGHSNFRTGILVTFDLKYPQYFTKQLQRYHFIQYVSSTSMMHRITKMDFDKCCNKYVSGTSIYQMKTLVNFYNLLDNNRENDDLFNEIARNFETWVCQNFDIELEDRSWIWLKKEDVLHDCYMCIISNCPMGAELWVHCSTNYEQLATIYNQRKNHKLKEDWGEFCKWIESLPYSKEFIICQ